MLTFFSFLIVIVGSLNWFFISAFQYDFIAGFFGTQASLFSRFVYFIIGMASFVLIAMVLKNKGTLKITENSFKLKKPEKKKSEETQVNHEEAPQDSFDNDAYTNSENLSLPSQTKGKEGFKDFDITKYDN